MLRVVPVWLTMFMLMVSLVLVIGTAQTDIQFFVDPVRSITSNANPFDSLNHDTNVCNQ
jgi:hypothetical protein